MREIRLSGSEGGGAKSIVTPYPYHKAWGGAKRKPRTRCGRSREPTKWATGAPESARSQRGESPLQVNALRPVTECNCDAAMRGGEQQEVKDQSVG